jgi:hypothetical protein
MAITDLGSMQLTATLQHSRWIKIPAGNMYSFLWYWIGTQPTNMFTLNHDTGVVTPTVRGPVGRPYCSIHHPTDNLIYPGIAGNPYESPVISFNPVTGAYTYLHAGPSYSTADGGPQYDGPGNGNITWSDEPHKRVFFYGHYRAGLWAWDPTYAPLDPAGFQDYGIVDNPGGTWAMRYGLSMQVNATHAFVPIYTSGTGLSYLAMVRLSDGVTTTKWKGTSITTITVERGYDEKIYISTKIGAAAAVWYESTDLDTPISTPSPYPGYLRTWVDYTGYSCYESLAIPDGSGNLTIPLNYKKPGDTDWRTVYTDLLDVTPYGIMNAGLDLDNNVVCFSENDGPMTKVVTANNTKTGKGFYPGFSGYSIGADYHRRLEFLGGYSAQAYQYNPALPFVAGTNPHSVLSG